MGLFWFMALPCLKKLRFFRANLDVHCFLAWMTLKHNVMSRMILHASRNFLQRLGRQCVKVGKWLFGPRRVWLCQDLGLTTLDQTWNNIKPNMKKERFWAMRSYVLVENMFGFRNSKRGTRLGLGLKLICSQLPEATRGQGRFWKLWRPKIVGRGNCWATCATEAGFDKCFVVLHKGIQTVDEACF